MCPLALRHRLEYLVFRLGVCLLQTLTLRQTIRVGEWLAWVLVDVLPRRWTRYDIAVENITRALGDSRETAIETNPAEAPTGTGGRESTGVGVTSDEAHRIIREMWVHLFRLVAEMAQLPRKMTLTNCREVVVFRNRKVVLEAFCTGRPVIVLGGHFGNWEVSTATFGLFGLPMGIVGRELDNPYLNEWFARTRVATGHRLYLKKGASDGMLELLEAGGNLGVLCDQDAGPKGLFVDFFGRPASTFKSIALMALEYRALIVVGYGIRLPDDLAQSRWAHFEIGCEEVIDPEQVEADDPLREITQRFTSALERAVRRAPEQYFWVHRRWKTPARVRKSASRTTRAA